MTIAPYTAQTVGKFPAVKAVQGDCELVHWLIGLPHIPLSYISLSGIRLMAQWIILT